MARPDVLHLTKVAGPTPYQWQRRTASGAIVATPTTRWATKAAMWRNARRTNPDWETCRVDDHTLTWATGGTNLSRPAGTRSPREFLPIPELRKRL